MKTTAEIIDMLHDFKAHSAEKYGILILGLFGSAARGEQKEDSGHRDFLLSNDGMNLFDATCMRIQIGLRNVISHEYASIDPEIIFNIVKKYLPPLQITLRRLIDDLETGQQDELFRQLEKTHE